MGAFGWVCAALLVICFGIYLPLCIFFIFSIWTSIFSSGFARVRFGYSQEYCRSCKVIQFSGWAGALVATGGLLRAAENIVTRFLLCIWKDHVEAAYNLGLMFLQGRGKGVGVGVESGGLDYHRASNLFKKVSSFSACFELFFKCLNTVNWKYFALPNGGMLCSWYLLFRLPVVDLLLPSCG